MGSNPICPSLALLVELVDTTDSSFVAFPHVGSTPTERIGVQNLNMIQLRSRRKVVDNSGVREVRCIQVKSTKASEGKLGHLVVASVTKTRSGSSWKRGDLVNGVRVMLKKETLRNGGMWVRQDENAIVLLNKKGELLGTRILGLVPVELRSKGYGKLVSMSEYIV